MAPCWQNIANKEHVVHTERNIIYSDFDRVLFDAPKLVGHYATTLEDEHGDVPAGSVRETYRLIRTQGNFSLSLFARALSERTSLSVHRLISFLEFQTRQIAPALIFPDVAPFVAWAQQRYHAEFRILTRGDPEFQQLKLSVVLPRIGLEGAPCHITELPDGSKYPNHTLGGDQANPAFIPGPNDRALFLDDKLAELEALWFDYSGGAHSPVFGLINRTATRLSWNDLMRCKPLFAAPSLEPNILQPILDEVFLCRPTS